MIEKVGKSSVSNISDNQNKNISKIDAKDNMQEYWDNYIQDSAKISGMAQSQFILADASQVTDNEDVALKQFTELKTSLNTAIDKSSAASDLYNKATEDFNKKDYASSKALYGQAVVEYRGALTGLEDVVTKAEAIIAKNPDDKDFVALLNRAKEISAETIKHSEEAKRNEKESEKNIIKVDLKSTIDAAYDNYNNGNKLIEMGNTRLKAEKYLEADDLYKKAVIEFKKVSSSMEAVINSYGKICEQYSCTENEVKNLDTLKNLLELSNSNIIRLSNATIDSSK